MVPASLSAAYRRFWHEVGESFPDLGRCAVLKTDLWDEVKGPGGRAVVGVPNRWDPFLRPLLASVLQALRLYD